MMKKIIILCLLLSSAYPFCFGQETESFEEEMYEKLRKSIIRTVIDHPRGSADEIYIAYSFYVHFGEDVTIEFSESTPSKVVDRKWQTKQSIKKDMEEEGINMDKEITIIYPVLNIWGDKKPDREDNLEEVMTEMFTGIEMQPKGPVRIERPIVTYLLGSTHGTK